MSLLILYTRWDCPPPQAVIARCSAAILPPERLARIGGAEPERQFQILAAYALLLRGARRVLGCAALPPLCYGAQGKPGFSEYPALQFNLSHTRGLALCALSDHPVGVDGEQLRAVAAERAHRLGLPLCPADFYAGWVERESRIKCRGGSAAKCRAPVSPLEGEFYHTLPMGERHVAGVCAMAPEAPELEQILPSMLFC